MPGKQPRLGVIPNRGGTLSQSTDGSVLGLHSCRALSPGPQSELTTGACNVEGRTVEKWLAFGYSISVATDRTHQPERPAMQLEVKTLLNRIQHFAGFVYRAEEHTSELQSPC